MTDRSCLWHDSACHTLDIAEVTSCRSNALNVCTFEDRFAGEQIDRGWQALQLQLQLVLLADVVRPAPGCGVVALFGR